MDIIDTFDRSEISTHYFETAIVSDNKIDHKTKQNIYEQLYTNHKEKFIKLCLSSYIIVSDVLANFSERQILIESLIESVTDKTHKFILECITLEIINSNMLLNLKNIHFDKIKHTPQIINTVMYYILHDKLELNDNNFSIFLNKMYENIFNKKYEMILNNYLVSKSSNVTDLDFLKSHMKNIPQYELSALCGLNKNLLCMLLTIESVKIYIENYGIVPIVKYEDFLLNIDNNIFGHYFEQLPYAILNYIYGQIDKERFISHIKDILIPLSLRTDLNADMKKIMRHILCVSYNTVPAHETNIFYANTVNNDIAGNDYSVTLIRHRNLLPHLTLCTIIKYSADISNMSDETIIRLINSEYIDHEIVKTHMKKNTNGAILKEYIRNKLSQPETKEKIYETTKNLFFSYTETHLKTLLEFPELFKYAFDQNKDSIISKLSYLGLAIDIQCDKMKPNDMITLIKIHNDEMSIQSTKCKICKLSDLRYILECGHPLCKDCSDTLNLVGSLVCPRCNIESITIQPLFI